MDDYRNTPFCPRLKDLAKKKSSFFGGKSYSNHYLRVSDKDKGKFASLFNDKCAYCGFPVGLLSPIDLFEIDHFVCYSSARWGDRKEDANNIENLVFSCRACNRGKSNYPFEEEYDALFDPESGLPLVFCRDEESLRILISDSYKDDSVVEGLYRALKLDHDFRLYDYILMFLERASKQDCYSATVRASLQSAMVTLLDARNRIPRK